MKERKAVLLMLLASFLWGLTFAFQSKASSVIGPFMFNGIRNIIGVIVLLPLIFKNLKNKDRAYFLRILKGGFFCGIFLMTASAAQQIGIGMTSAGKTGFLTSLYTLFVPIFSVFLKKSVPLKIWLCVAVAIVGSFFLCINGDKGISQGDLWVLLCAVLFAFQIMCIEKFSKDVDGIDLSAMQFLVAGIINLIVGFFTETISLSIISDALIPILYSGIFSCGVAYTLQIIGQKYVPATKATLALSLESAWAAVGAAIILGERMSGKELFGCVLVFAAVVLSQLEFKKSK